MAGNAGKGRQAGVPNKLTASIKQAFLLAYEGAGGLPELIAWAKENRTEFYKLLARLIPVEVNAHHTFDPSDATDAELAAIAFDGSADAAGTSGSAHKPH